MLEEHLGRHSDDEGGIVTAGGDIGVGSTDLLYSGHYSLSMVWFRRKPTNRSNSRRHREAGCVQGKETVPVTSLEGAMGVLL